jgi:hypothetical protein
VLHKGRLFIAFGCRADDGRIDDRALRMQAPFASRSRAIASNRLRSRPRAASARRKRYVCRALGRCFVAGKAAKAPEARPVFERFGKPHVGKIVTLLRATAP